MNDTFFLLRIREWDETLQLFSNAGKHYVMRAKRYPPHHDAEGTSRSPDSVIQRSRKTQVRVIIMTTERAGPAFRWARKKSTVLGCYSVHLNVCLYKGMEAQNQS